jgi:hypothetical protein
MLSRRRTHQAIPRAMLKWNSNTALMLDRPYQRAVDDLNQLMDAPVDCMSELPEQKSWPADFRIRTKLYAAAANVNRQPTL